MFLLHHYYRVEGPPKLFLLCLGGAKRASGSGAVSEVKGTEL